MTHLIFYDKNNNELHKLNIEYIIHNCTDIYNFLKEYIYNFISKEYSNFDDVINYIDRYISNIKSNNINNINNTYNTYNINYTILDELIYTKNYTEIQKFYNNEIIRINKIMECENISDNISDNIKIEENKILINKLLQIKILFEDYNCDKNYYVILLI